MTEEQKKEAVSTNEQPSTTTTTTEPTLSKEQKSPDKISVDIAPGVSIDLDVDTAKKVIEHRNAKSKGYKDLETRLKEVEGAKKVAEERAKLVELAKAQDYDALKAEASKEYADKLRKIEDKIVAKEIESALLSADDFLKESKDDAIKLLKAEHTFKVNEEGDEVVNGDGKKVHEVVKDWLSKKDIFRKAKGATGTGAKVIGGKNPIVAQTRNDVSANMSKGLGKIYGA